LFLQLAVIVLTGYLTASLNFRGVRSSNIEKLALGLVLFMELPLLTFLLNLILMGQVLSNPAYVRVLFIAFVLTSVFSIFWKDIRLLVYSRGMECRAHLRTWRSTLDLYKLIDGYDIGLVILIGTALALAFFPELVGAIFILGRGGGDYSLHIGWANQLIIGKTLPYNCYSDAPNYYPWLFHATLSFFAQLFLINAMEAYSILDFSLIMALPLSIYIFASYVTKGNKKIGLISAYFATLSGGFDWFELLGISPPRPDVVTPSPLFQLMQLNSSVMNIAPTYPREVAIPVIAVFLYLLCRAFKEGGKIFYFNAGILMGFMALLHVNGFMLSISVTIVLAMFLSIRKLRKDLYGVLITILISISLASLFYFPFVLNYLEFGGLVSTTLMKPRFYSLYELFYAFGFVSVYSLFGIAVLLRRRDLKEMPWQVLLIALGVAIGFSSLGVLEENFELFGAVGPVFRAHRFYLILPVFLAVFSATGFEKTLSICRTRRNRKVALGLIIVVTILLGLYSPVKWSLYIKDTYHKVSPGYFDENTIFSLTKRNISCNDVVFAPPAISKLIWALTGVDVVWVSRPIPWRNINQSIFSQEERTEDTNRIYKGPFDPEQFENTLKKYGVTFYIATKGQVQHLTNMPTLRLIGSGWMETPEGRVYYYLYKHEVSGLS